jgi:hypothetical protein
MKVYLVLEYDTYYPSGDNVRAVFTNLEDAEEYQVSLRGSSDYDYVKVVGKEVLSREIHRN